MRWIIAAISQSQNSVPAPKFYFANSNLLPLKTLSFPSIRYSPNCLTPADPFGSVFPNNHKHLVPASPTDLHIVFTYDHVCVPREPFVSLSLQYHMQLSQRLHNAGSEMCSGILYPSDTALLDSFVNFRGMSEIVALWQNLFHLSQGLLVSRGRRTLPLQRCTLDVSFQTSHFLARADARDVHEAGES